MQAFQYLSIFKKLKTNISGDLSFTKTCRIKILQFFVLRFREFSSMATQGLSIYSRFCFYVNSSTFSPFHVEFTVHLANIQAYHFPILASTSLKWLVQSFNYSIMQYLKKGNDGLWRSFFVKQYFLAVNYCRRKAPSTASKILFESFPSN